MDISRWTGLPRHWALQVGGALLELVYPETCALCDVEPESSPWCAPGPVVAGLDRWDGTYLCRQCAATLTPDQARVTLAAGLPAHGGQHPTPELVRLLGQWKYHGIRGLAWPLAGLMTAAVSAAVARDGAVDLLVPVALHGRRRRERGFNQAEVLAQLVAVDSGVPVAVDLLHRIRVTGQQARLKSVSARRRNLEGAFVVRAPAMQGSAGCRVGIVDDLVTSGATCEAAAAALRGQGWQVQWVAALGLAALAGTGEGLPGVPVTR